MGKIISVSGIDGSGKTTIINQLQREFNAQGKKTKYVWLRYNHYLTKYLLGFCKLIKLTRYDYNNGVRIGYHEFYRSTFISYLFIILTFVDTLASSFCAVYLPVIFSGHIIICDRWIYDILIDLEIDTRINFSKNNYIARVYKKLVPHTAHCFLIKRNYKTIKNQRIENSYDRNFKKRFQLFEKLVTDKRLHVIDNNGTIAYSIKQINDAIK